MRILTTPPRVLTRALVASATVFASLAIVAALAVIGASPASATTICNTPGHAYVTQPGTAFFSGYEGDQRFGVPTLSYVQGTQSFRLGGNGIRPGSQIVFFAINTDTGAAAGLVNPGFNYNTRGAGSNCVVNEEGPFVFALQPGNYRIQAAYIGGNSGQFVVDVVTNVQVQAPPPPPPYDPYDPGNTGYDPCAGAPFGGCYIG
jgi:hypothetical protein